MTYTLASISDGEAVFENPESDKHRRYDFKKDGDHMVVSVGAYKDGKIGSSDFRYDRK